MFEWNSSFAGGFTVKTLTVFYERGQMVSLPTFPSQMETRAETQSFKSLA